MSLMYSTAIGAYIQDLTHVRTEAELIEQHADDPDALARIATARMVPDKTVRL